MAIKKNEMYTSLYAACDELRGGMDPSQYKNYILRLLFVKYVSDKFKGVPFAEIQIPEGGSYDDILKWRGHKNIGEEITYDETYDINGDSSVNAGDLTVMKQVLLG